MTFCDCNHDPDCECKGLARCLNCEDYGVFGPNKDRCQNWWKDEQKRKLASKGRALWTKAKKSTFDLRDKEKRMGPYDGKYYPYNHFERRYGCNSEDIWNESPPRLVQYGDYIDTEGRYHGLFCFSRYDPYGFTLEMRRDHTNGIYYREDEFVHYHGSRVMWDESFEFHHR